MVLRVSGECIIIILSSISISISIIISMRFIIITVIIMIILVILVVVVLLIVISQRHRLYQRHTADFDIIITSIISVILITSGIIS